MTVRSVGLWGVLAFMPLFGQQGSDAVAIGHRQPSVIRDKAQHFDGTVESTNWSGYAVTGSTFTSVTGSWVVEPVTCTGTGAGDYAAFWVGLDGYSSSTVEQIGTGVECIGRIPYYYAWYELYPVASEAIPLAVYPGNYVSASVAYTSGGFTLTITNVTTGKSYSKTAQVTGAARSSAEWVVEAPCCTGKNNGILPLADFGTVGFGPIYTHSASDDANAATIGSYGTKAVLINKVGSSTSPQLSTCSILASDKNSFSCTWQP